MIVGWQQIQRRAETGRECEAIWTCIAISLHDQDGNDSNEACKVVLVLVGMLFT